MSRDIACPVCDADLLFAGDEEKGDTILCVYCGSPYLVRKVATLEDDWDLEEDF